MTASANFLERPRIREFVRRVITEWRAGTPLGRAPKAADLLQRYPELRRNKSVVLDLAYEEFCLRREGGKSLDLGLFCLEFPTFGRSLERLLLLHEHLDPLLEAAVSSPPRSWPAVGQRLGDFELLELLGQGGVSRVFLARQGDLGGRTVVVKISPYATVEADAIGRLGHPHIVPILSQQLAPDGPWVLVCMPYLGRRTLADDLDERFASGRLRPAAHREAVVRCIRQLADALATTHERGLLHGDLKPSNVLLDFQGAPRLMDFHLAEPIGQATARVSGTLPYMSPELLTALLPGSGRTARISDPRSDLFSLGVMLVEALTGKRPFGEPDLTCSLARQVEQQLERRQSSRTDWDHDPPRDPALLAIASACLAYDMRDRIPSAGALRDRLDDYLAGCERRRQRKVRSCNTAGIIGCVAAIIVVACGAIAWYRSASGTPQRVEDSMAALREYVEARELYAAGHVAAATNRINACLNLVTTDPRPLVARGHVHRRRGLHESGKVSWDLAALDYARALRWEDSGLTRACLSECFLRSEHPRDAITHGEAALRMGYETAALHGNLALAYAAVSDWEAADRAMREAMRVDSSLQPLPIPWQSKRVALELWKFASLIRPIPGEFPGLEPSL